MTQTLAGQLFGAEVAMGKVIRSSSGYDLKVTAIMKDLPDNSHLNLDALQLLATNESLARSRQQPGSNRPIWLENYQIYPYIYNLLNTCFYPVL